MTLRVAIAGGASISEARFSGSCACRCLVPAAEGDRADPAAAFADCYACALAMRRGNALLLEGLDLLQTDVPQA